MISDTEWARFTGVLDLFNFFGASVAAVSDFGHGDDVGDITLSWGQLHCDDDGGSSTGAVSKLFLNSDTTVKGYQKTSDTAGKCFGGWTAMPLSERLSQRLVTWMTTAYVILS